MIFADFSSRTPGKIFRKNSDSLKMLSLSTLEQAKPASLVKVDFKIIQFGMKFVGLWKGVKKPSIRDINASIQYGDYSAFPRSPSNVVRAERGAPSIWRGIQSSLCVLFD